MPRPVEDTVNSGTKRSVRVVFLLSSVFASIGLFHLLLLAQAPDQTGRPTSPQETEEDAPERVRESVLEGSELDDVLKVPDLDSWLFGGDGDDALHGGAGNDALEGGSGDDRLLGGDGDDALDGGAGNDLLKGGAGSDMIDGGDDEDTLIGGAGADDMEGGDADDVLRGDSDDDTLAGGDGDDVLIGGDGDDRLFGRDGDDKLNGGPGNDALDGGDGADLLDGGDGDDALKGGELQDLIRGAAGNDVLDGGIGGDLLNAGPGNDVVLGSGGDDFVDGGDGHDTLEGGPGMDTIAGGQGYDWLEGGLGSDTIRAGSEDDLIVVRAGDVDAETPELIDGGSGNDTLILNGFAHRIAADTAALRDGNLLMTDPYSGGVYHLSNLEELRYAQIFTQLSSDGSQSGSLVLVNPSATTSGEFDAAFFDHDGSPQGLSIGTATPAPRYRRSIAPLGLANLATAGIDGSLQGTALVLADRPLGAASAGARESLLGDNFLVPVSERQDAGIHTGVVLFSSTVASSVKLTLHRQDGEEVSTESRGGVEIEIPAHGRRQLLIREVFSDLLLGSDFEGILTIEGGIDRPQDGGSLTVTGVLQESGGRTSTFSAVQMAPAPPVQTLHFTGLTAGEGATSSIVLVNPSTADIARGSLRFFDDSGAPWDSALEASGSSAAETFEIAPLGSKVIRTAGTGPLQRGNARTEGVPGALAAVIRTGLRAESPVGGPSGVYQNFIAPALRDEAVGSNTRLTLVSTQSALNLTLVLRDTAGAEVPGGRSQLQTAPNGSVRGTLDDLFPNADTAAFQGTLTAEATGGDFAAQVVHMSRSAPVVAPMVPLQP